MENVPGIPGAFYVSGKRPMVQWLFNSASRGGHIRAYNTRMLKKNFLIRYVLIDMSQYKDAVLTSLELQL